MKRFTIAMMALVFAMGMPMIATAAMDHGSDDKEMAGDMKHDMSAMEGGFVEIGKDTQNGVVATIKIKTYDDKTLASMKKMGMNATHHVMVFFTDEKTGETVASGKAALKIKGDDAKPAMLMLMGTGVGGDVTVGEGMATFEIGTKLEDGKNVSSQSCFTICN